MRALTHSFDTLKMSTEDVLQFHFWRAMPYELQNQLINITNCNRLTVKQIEDNIFAAIERFQMHPSKQNKSAYVDKAENKATSSANFLSAS